MLLSTHARAHTHIHNERMKWFEKYAHIIMHVQGKQEGTAVGRVTHRDTGIKFNCEDANDKEKQEKKSGEVSNGCQRPQQCPD